MPRRFPSSGVNGRPSAGIELPIEARDWRAIRAALQLTSRESDIVQALFAGQREDDIAAALGISRYTVHTHIGRLYRKLQVDSCSGLLLRVFREVLTIRAPVGNAASASAPQPLPPAEALPAHPCR